MSKHLCKSCNMTLSPTDNFCRHCGSRNKAIKIVVPESLRTRYRMLLSGWQRIQKMMTLEYGDWCKNSGYFGTLIRIPELESNENYMKSFISANNVWNSILSLSNEILTLNGYGTEENLTFIKVVDTISLNYKDPSKESPLDIFK